MSLDNSFYRLVYSIAYSISALKGSLDTLVYTIDSSIARIIASLGGRVYCISRYNDVHGDVVEIDIDSINSIETDIVLLDSLIYDNDSWIEILGSMENSLFIINNLYSLISKDPEATKKFVDIGYVKSIAPIGEGILVLYKRLFDKEFLRETIRVYRDSFIQGPNPIHYNTAYFLYNIGLGILSRSAGKRFIVEIGCGRGFSTLWLGLVAKHTNGLLYSFDINCERVSYTEDVLEETGLARWVRVECIDAREYASRIREDVTLLFIDGFKNEYHSYLESYEHKLRRGSIVIAHNTLSHPHDMVDYINRVYSSRYISVTIPTDPAGTTLSIHK